ncbi:MAG: hypothetical protein J0L86_04655 [Flavobacteriales bacterium]|nr:hypothetical protein [Flavobacteriales bacterium]
MEKKTEGAWIINHTKKLQKVDNTQDFEEIELAGKCGSFLSNLAASHEISEINKTKVEAIAKASNIKRIELETIKKTLCDARLIDIGANGSVSVLGITTHSVLGHTSDIFRSVNPTDFQKASLDLAENISDLPKEGKLLQEYISDTHKLSSTDIVDLFKQSENIGFIDFETLDDKSKMYFNGNLFRRDVMKKTQAVLSTLSQTESRLIGEVDALLSEKGCLAETDVKRILGDQLLSKLQSIGMYDFNDVSNSSETKTIITKPSAFSKYGNPFEEDALDLAKAFVSSLFYGMNYSANSRGKITMLKALMQRLIRGGEVGPATAIGEDYRLLEFKRVVAIRPDPDYPSRYYMRLLKRDIGELALQVLEFGDANQHTVMSSGSVTKYKGPEEKRVANRLKENEASKKTIAQTLKTIRQ